jgi:putative peptidoglycan lipid II flippase
MKEENKNKAQGKGWFIKTTLIVMIVTALSRVLGYVREVVVAAYYGTGYEVDAYRVAIQLPNLFRLLIGDAVIAAAFVPIFSSYLAKNKEKEAWEVASRILTSTILLLLFLTVVGELAAPFLIKVLAPGFEQKIETYELSIKLTRIMFPALVFMALSGLFSGMLNSYSIFLLPSASPIIWNAIIIAAIILFSKNYGIFAFATGLLAASIVQALIQIPAFGKKIRLWKPVLDFSHPEVRNFLKILAPIVLSAATSNINTIIDTRFASYLETGVIAAMGYAIRIYLVPAGVFGVAFATVLFPRLSELQTLEEEKKFARSLSYGMRLLGYLIVPIATFFVAFSLPVVRILFERGEFRYSDSLLTSAALSMYSIGVVAFSLTTLFTRAYYSKKDSKTPMLIALASILVNYIGDWLLMRAMPMVPEKITVLQPLKWLFAPHAGIALSTSIVSIFQLLALLYFYRRMHGEFDYNSFSLTLIKSVAASIAAAFVGYGVYNVIQIGETAGLLLRLFAVLFSGTLVYVGITYILKMEEVALAAGFLRERFSRQKR